jgi:UDP:flavonoid glycosyltransferase YjiC (YdhE family)
LAAHVEAEVAAIKDYKADAVYMGMNVPCVISARAVGIPLIFVLPVPVTATYFHHRLATYPESHEKLISRILPQKWKDYFFNWLMPRLHIGIKTFNRAAKPYGLPPFKSFVGDIFSGDLTLLPDIPELTGIPESDFPTDHYYIGPLFAHLPLAVPDQVRKVFNRPGINVYVSMGSSAQPSVLLKAVKFIVHSGYNAVIATTSILDPEDLQPLPENVYAVRYLPAPEVNEMADVAVIHGGQGTVQTACWAGTPIVGVALQFEQQANLDMVVRAGMGIRIPMRRYSKTNLLEAIEKVTTEKSYRKNAQKIQIKIRSLDGAANAAERILAYMRKSLGA